MIDLTKKIYAIEAEEIDKGWIFNITGGYDSSNSRPYYNKKVKIAAVSNMQSALEKAQKLIGITEYTYSLKVKTLADKKALIDFYRKPIPKLFKKLETAFADVPDVYVVLSTENKINIIFGMVFIDEYETKHRLSARIKNSELNPHFELNFYGDHGFLRKKYQEEIKKIIDMVKG